LRGLAGVALLVRAASGRDGLASLLPDVSVAPTSGAGDPFQGGPP
jgi:hypothetical protein